MHGIISELKTQTRFIGDLGRAEGRCLAQPNGLAACTKAVRQVETDVRKTSILRLALLAMTSCGSNLTDR